MSRMVAKAIHSTLKPSGCFVAYDHSVLVQCSRVYERREERSYARAGLPSRMPQLFVCGRR